MKLPPAGVMVALYGIALGYFLNPYLMVAVTVALVLFMLLEPLTLPLSWEKKSPLYLWKEMRLTVIFLLVMWGTYSVVNYYMLLSLIDWLFRH